MSHSAQTAAAEAYYFTYRERTFWIDPPDEEDAEAGCWGRAGLKVKLRLKA